MLKINMFSNADAIKGQGVGAAYNELINMLKKYFPNEMDISINEERPADITHYHTIDPKYYLSTFTPKHRGTLVGYVHFLPETLDGSLKFPSFLKGMIYKYVLSFYHRMDQLVVVNPSFIEKLVAHGLPESKITYIPNFVSKEMFYEESQEDKLAFRKEMNIDPDKLVVLGVGQIQKRKGIDDFVQLAMDNPHIQFIWAGGFSFGQITDGYDKYKAIYDNPPANLLFPGIVERSQMNRYYNLADVFLLPSYNELFPMAILEAFSSSTVVMLRDLELYHSIIKDYYCPTKNIDEMHVALNDFDNRRDLLQQYVEKSRQASKQYSEDNVAKLWYEYYHRIAQN